MPIEIEPLQIDEVELRAFDLFIFLVSGFVVGFVDVIIDHAGGVDLFADDHVAAGLADDLVAGFARLPLILGIALGSPSIAGGCRQCGESDV